MIKTTWTGRLNKISYTFFLECNPCYTRYMYTYMHMQCWLFITYNYIFVDLRPRVDSTTGRNYRVPYANYFTIGSGQQVTIKSVYHWVSCIISQRVKLPFITTVKSVQSNMHWERNFVSEQTGLCCYTMSNIQRSGQMGIKPNVG